MTRNKAESAHLNLAPQTKKGNHNHSIFKPHKEITIVIFTTNAIFKIDQTKQETKIVSLPQAKGNLKAG